MLRKLAVSSDEKLKGKSISMRSAEIGSIQEKCGISDKKISKKARPAADPPDRHRLFCYRAFDGVWIFHRAYKARFHHERGHMF